MTKRWVQAGSVLAATALLTAALAPWGDPEHTAPSPSRRPVATVRVQLVTGYLQERHATGEVRARRRSAVGFEVGGRVARIRADVGDRVAAGEHLADLDTQALDADRAVVAARLEASRALLAELVAGPRVEVVAAARAAVDRFDAEHVLAGLELSRRVDLVERAVESAADLDAAQARERGAAAQLSGAKARLAELEAGTRPEQIAAQRARVAELTAALEQIDVRLRQSRLAAPFDAVVAAREVDEGAVVEIGQPILRLVESGRLEAWVGVPEAVALGGGEHEVRVGGRQYQLPVARTLPEIDRSTRTRPVVFELPDGAAVVPGDIARLTTRRQVAVEGFWLPLSALTESARGLWSCLVLDGDRVARAEVEVLHVDGEQALVRGTLQAGDLVVVGGTQRVVPGQRVRPQIGV